MSDVKLIGAVMTIITAAAVGEIIARGYRDRPKYLREILRALQMLETEINYSSSNLPNALAKVGRFTKGRVSEIFLRTSEHLASSVGFTASEAWQNAIFTVFPYTPLTNEDKDILISFGNSLGISDRTDQLKHISLAREQIKREEDEAGDQSRKYVKLFRYMGFCLGMVIVLLLY